MSAPLHLTSDAARSVAEFLQGATQLKRRTGCDICAYGGIDVAVPGGSILRVNWDENDGYVIDDRSGS